MRTLAAPVAMANLALVTVLPLAALMGACSLETGVLGAGDGGFADAADAAGEAGEAGDAGPPPDSGAMDSAIVDSGASDSAMRPDTSPPDTGAGPSFCDGTDPALRVCMRFEDSLTDEAPAAHTVTGMGHGFAAGHVGRAFDHSPGDQVWFTDASDLATLPFTVELWFRPDALPSSGRVGIADFEGAYGLFIYPGGQVACRTNSNAQSGDGAAVMGRWTHLACVVEVGRMRTYVDGSLAADTMHTWTSGGASDAFRLGGNSPSGDDFEGRVDEFRIFDDVRTESEIAAAAGR